MHFITLYFLVHKIFTFNINVLYNFSAQINRQKVKKKDRKGNQK